jgi:hypothetical protein
MTHNVFTGDQREQSRLIFNGPVGCYKQLAGPFNITALRILYEPNMKVNVNRLKVT